MSGHITKRDISNVQKRLNKKIENEDIDLYMYMNEPNQLYLLAE